MRTMLLFLSLAVVAGCGDAVAPVPPDIVIYGQRPLEPVPTDYAAWYAEIEAGCGHRGDFRGASWHVADSIFVGGRRWSNVADVNGITVQVGYADSEAVVGFAMTAHVQMVAAAPCRRH